ncbi:hypothetical protein SAMN05446037_100984 [Anaerovirgula multivorans]|uniref:Uncharacterized protein n=1 Tax=Anaerovirgula multivorans TaxID=312168 RepID=A0A239E6A7_9FIRM|nr:hypothetical protein [Anaerovirgula multivorans]SNS39989.1 hypothetical protein SAMN05446037_100984 [Anaerovirgula multivorans]
MENYKDVEIISKQLNALKQNIDQSKEHLSAVEMLMVDDNNSRLKDKRLFDDFQQLNASFESLMNSIKALENKLNH